MLTKKHSENFLKIHDVENSRGKIIKNIIETEEELKINLLDWSEDNVIVFLKKANAASPQTLNKHMSTLRKFAEFICKKEKLPIQSYVFQEENIFLRLIDRRQLLRVTLNYDEYLTIREQINKTEDGESINTRNKLIFELAWVGLTNDEIKFIKEKDIEFIKMENGSDITILNLENKTLRIEDDVITTDVKLCLKEKYCIGTAKDGRIKKTFYKDSEYLIKPVQVGPKTGKTYIDNPHLALRRVLEAGEIICEGIDVEKLTLSDIRRSKLIYLLAPENEEFFNLETVAKIYNLRNSEGLRWYKDIAQEKYK